MTQDLAPGDRVGPYELIEQAGRGGQAEVWRATLSGPASYHKQVALKILHADAMGDLKREHRLGGLIGHPNVVEVYDVGAASGRPYLALEWIDGPSLAELARREALSPRAVADLGVGVAAALAHAHERGVVHGDVAPGNVLLTAGGVPKLSDLGLALFAADDGARPSAATPGYAAPELLGGGAIDGRTDVWALGALLFLAATGRPLFAPTLALDGVGVATALARVEDALVATPELASWIRAMLAVDPGDRPGAAAVQAGLQKLLLPGSPLGPAAPAQAPAVAPPTLGNLQKPADPFFGRASERAWLLEQLRGGAGAALTLHGTGGIGKTRLALEVAAEIAAPGGCWFIDLGEARDELQVATATGTALGLKVGESLDAEILRALTSRPPMVLVLDNAEQAVDAVAASVGRWVQAAPAHRYLVTSREPLGIPRERVLSVGPTDPETQLALLRSRARAAGWDGVDDHRLPELLDRLDGIPLAIELTATRIAQRGVVDSIEALAEGEAAGVDLHPAMARALDASWDLLDVHERAALTQWAVFAGGFSPEAADAVLELPGDAPWSLDLLDALLRKGLLAERGQDHEGTPRFGLYVPVLQYVRAKTGGGAEQAEARHGRYYGGLAGRKDAGLIGRLDRSNAVVALDRAIARSDGEVAAYVGHLLWLGYELTGPLSSGLDAVDRALGCLELGRAHRANLLYSRGSALMRLGRMDEAREALEVALVACDELGLAERGAACHNILGSLHHLKQRVEPATHHLFEAERAYGALGDRRSQAVVLANIGTLRLGQGRHDEAGAAYEKSVEMLRRTGDPRREATILGNLALIREHSGRLEEARDLLQRALTVHRELENRHSEGVALGNLGYVLWRLGDREQARSALEQAIEIHKDVGNRRSEAIAWRNLGLLEWRCGHRDIARACYAAALEGSRAASNRQEIAVALTALARAELHAGNTDVSGLLDEASALAESLDVDELRALAHLGRIAHVHALGDPSTARRLWEEGREGIEGVTVAHESELETALRDVRGLMGDP